MTEERKALWSGIVKVQRAVAGVDSLLIYNEDRSLDVEFFAADYTPEQWEESIGEFGADKPKRFYNAEVDADYNLRIITEAEWQEW